MKFKKWIKDNLFLLLGIWWAALSVLFAFHPCLELAFASITTLIGCLGFFVHLRLVGLTMEADRNHNIIECRLRYIERLLENVKQIPNLPVVNVNGNELITPCNSQNEKDANQ